MVQELAEPKEYVPLIQHSMAELKEIAKQLGRKVPPNLKREKLVHLIKTEQAYQNLRAEKEAMTRMDVEEKARLGVKDHPDRKRSLEEICIYGGVWPGKINGKQGPHEFEPSPKRLVHFINTVDPGADVRFSKGGIFFHIFDKDKNKQRVTNCLPACLISKEPRYEAVSLASPNRGLPVFTNVKNAAGEVVSELTGREPRFEFIDLGPAPKNAEFGLFIKELEDDDNDKKG